MAGNKEVNSNLQIKGKINLKDVPNNTPTGFLVWNSEIKDIAQRTPEQLLTDLNLITATNIAANYVTIKGAPQLITSKKVFNNEIVSYGDIILNHRDGHKAIGLLLNEDIDEPRINILSKGGAYVKLIANNTNPSLRVGNNSGEIIGTGISNNKNFVHLPTSRLVIGAFGNYKLDENFSFVNRGTALNEGDLTANSFIKIGGTSTQFLKADGSIDSSEYAETSWVNANFINNTSSNVIATTDWELRSPTFEGRNGRIPGDGYFKFIGDFPQMGWNRALIRLTDEEIFDIENCSIRQNGSTINSFSAGLYTASYVQAKEGFKTGDGVNNNVLLDGGGVKSINEFGKTYVSGDGISITGPTNVITNTKPNVVQTLSGSGNTVNLSNGGSYTIPAQTWGSITGKPEFNFLPSNPQLTYGASGLNYFNISGVSGNNPKLNQAPTDLWHHIIRMNHANAGGYYADLAISMIDNSGISRRVISNGAALSDWVKLWDSSHFTQSNINNWNQAFGWGNHATAGYLTSSALSPYAQTSWVNANFIPKSHPVYDVTTANINTWNEAYNKQIVGFTKSFNASGDLFKFYRQDGSSFEHASVGLAIIDTRYSLGNADVSSTYVPNGLSSEIDHKVIPLFHSTNQLGWSSSLLIKGWDSNYKCWKITGPSNVSDVEQDFYLSQTKSSDGTWLTDRKIWTDLNLPQTSINNWNTAFNNNHSHANKANLDSINQNLATWNTPTFNGLRSQTEDSMPGDLGNVGANSKLLLSNHGLYGMNFWVEGNGQGYIQQQRFDGTKAAYDLYLQPFGGNVSIGEYEGGNLRVGGSITSEEAFFGSAFYSNNLIGSQVFNTNGNTLYIGNPSLPDLTIESAGNIRHYSGGIFGTIWSTHNLNKVSQLSNDAGYLTSSALSPYAQTSWVNANFDKYAAWNLQTNNVQRTSMPSGSNLNLVAGANITISYSAGGTVTINAANSAQTLSFSQTTQSNQINISGGNSVTIENRFLGSFDGSRNPTDIKPNTSPHSIRADFANAGAVGGTGNYAGVLTYAPWDGTSGSTGDSSYQLAFINETGINGSGNPGLRLRKGIDTTWGNWISILTSMNGVTLDTAQTISGVKTFSNNVTAPAFYEGSLKSLKKNIKRFKPSGLALVEQLDIVTFDRKDESAKNKIGIIADDSPKEFLSEELDAVDLYKTVFIQAKAIQELSKELKDLRELILQNRP